MFHDKRLLRMGDTVLRVWARILQESCCKEDLAARLGGEEFVVLLPFTTEADAIQLAQRIGGILRTTNIPGIPRPVTVSMGVAYLMPSDTVSTILRRVDQALYVAKSKGRDCIVSASSLYSLEFLP
jgi:diguanylate cyclase (GGDEF)-like protein